MKRILAAAMLVLVSSLGACVESSVTVSCEGYYFIKFNEKNEKVKLFDENRKEISNLKVVKFTDEVIKFSTHTPGRSFLASYWTLDRVLGKLRTPGFPVLSLDCGKIKERKF